MTARPRRCTPSCSTSTTSVPRGPSPDAPSFTTDDVIEFHYLLEDDAYIREFFAKRG